MIITLKNNKFMKPKLHLLPIVLFGICLFSCTPKERPVPPSDGKEPVYIYDPQMVINDDHIDIFYIRNNEPVKAEILEDASLSSPVFVDDKKWLSIGESELVYLPEVDEDTKAVVENMPFASELVPTPDNVRLFFTAYSHETGKRELYWIRNGGILPVKLSQDNWWADFSVPFGFMEVKDQCFSDGSKAYVALCLANDHWNPGEICAVYMDGSTQYTILSHENTLLRDSLSKSVAVGKDRMTTSDGSVIHYVSYDQLGYAKEDHPVHIMYLDKTNNSSCVAWNEKALKNALAGERVIIVSDNDFFSKSDYEEFEKNIYTSYKQL